MSDILVFDTNQNNVVLKKHNPIDSVLEFNESLDKNVRGWFFINDSIIFHHLLNVVQHDITGDVCEIGVSFGKSATALSFYKRPEDNLVLFDLFEGTVKDTADDNIRNFGRHKNIVWNINDTLKLTAKDLKKLPDFRFIHIDGCHEEEAVLSDLTNFSKKLIENGVLVLDDFNDPEYPGVNSACTLFLHKSDFCIFAIGNNKAYICRTKYRELYLNRLLEIFKESKDINEQLVFKFKLRKCLEKNVLLCCSRESVDIEEIMKDLDAPSIIG
jgi:hypothetical protein